MLLTPIVRAYTHVHAHAPTFGSQRRRYLSRTLHADICRLWLLAGGELHRFKRLQAPLMHLAHAHISITMIG